MSHQIHRRIFQHARQQGIDAAAALVVKLLFELQEGLPLFDGKLGHSVPQRDVDQALLNDAGPARQRDGVAQLNQPVVVVIGIAA